MEQVGGSNCSERQGDDDSAVLNGPVPRRRARLRLGNCVARVASLGQDADRVLQLSGDLSDADPGGWTVRLVVGAVVTQVSGNFFMAAGVGVADAVAHRHRCDGRLLDGCGCGCRWLLDGF